MVRGKVRVKKTHTHKLPMKFGDKTAWQCMLTFPHASKSPETIYWSRTLRMGFKVAVMCVAAVKMRIIYFGPFLTEKWNTSVHFSPLNRVSFVRIRNVSGLCKAPISFSIWLEKRENGANLRLHRDFKSSHMTRNNSHLMLLALGFATNPLPVSWIIINLLDGNYVFVVALPVFQCTCALKKCFHFEYEYAKTPRSFAMSKSHHTKQKFELSCARGSHDMWLPLLIIYGYFSGITTHGVCVCVCYSVLIVLEAHVSWYAIS